MRVSILLLVVIGFALLSQSVFAAPSWMKVGANASYSGFWTFYYSNGTTKEREVATLNWKITALNSTDVTFNTTFSVQGYPFPSGNTTYSVTSRADVAGHSAFEWIPTQVTTLSIVQITVDSCGFQCDSYQVESQHSYKVNSGLSRSAWDLYFLNQTSSTIDHSKHLSYDMGTGILVWFNENSTFFSSPDNLNLNLTSTNISLLTNVPAFPSPFILSFALTFSAAVTALLRVKKVTRQPNYSSRASRRG